MKVNKYLSSHWSYEHKRAELVLAMRSTSFPTNVIFAATHQAWNAVSIRKHVWKGLLYGGGWRVEHVCSCENDWLHDIQNLVSFFSIYFFLCLSLDFPSHPKTQKKTRKIPNPNSKIQIKKRRSVSAQHVSAQQVCLPTRWLAGQPRSLSSIVCDWNTPGTRNLGHPICHRVPLVKMNWKRHALPCAFFPPPQKKNAPVFSRASWASSCGTFRVPILFLVAR